MPNKLRMPDGQFSYVFNLKNAVKHIVFYPNFYLKLSKKIHILRKSDILLNLANQLAVRFDLSEIKQNVIVVKIKVGLT